MPCPQSITVKSAKNQLLLVKKLLKIRYKMNVLQRTRHAVSLRKPISVNGILPLCPTGRHAGRPLREGWYLKGEVAVVKAMHCVPARAVR